MSDVVDKDEKIKKLEKELDKLNSEVKKLKQENNRLKYVNEVYANFINGENKYA